MDPLALTEASDASKYKLPHYSYHNDWHDNSGKVQAYGTISVNGYTVANEKIKGRGKLKVVGTLEGTDLEIYGNITITGHL